MIVAESKRIPVDEGSDMAKFKALQGLGFLSTLSHSFLPCNS